jgi:hypothetical protein
LWLFLGLGTPLGKPVPCNRQELICFRRSSNHNLRGKILKISMWFSLEHQNGPERKNNRDHNQKVSCYNSRKSQLLDHQLASTVSGSPVDKDPDHQLARTADHQLAGIRITSWQGPRTTSWQGSGSPVGKDHQLAKIRITTWQGPGYP